MGHKIACCTSQLLISMGPVKMALEEFSKWDKMANAYSLSFFMVMSQSKQRKTAVCPANQHMLTTVWGMWQPTMQLLNLTNDRLLGAIKLSKFSIHRHDGWLAPQIKTSKRK